MDYGKYRFEQQKRESLQRKKQKQIQVKEVKMRPRTDEGDFQVKLKNIKRFLEQGNKVKISIRFRGREMAHQELGGNLMQRIQEEIGEEASLEREPKLEGRQMLMILGPPSKPKK
jgi:translation initiation factor IF-3